MPDQELITALVRLVSAVSPTKVRAFADILAKLPVGSGREVRHRALRELPGSSGREAFGKIVDLWDGLPDIGPETLAFSLRLAAEMLEAGSPSGAVSLVWTGPVGGDTLLRDTEQALLEVVNSAVVRLDICTFAAYRITSVADALSRAIGRGVAVDLIVETAGEGGSLQNYDMTTAFAEAVGEANATYIWPLKDRLKSAKGTPATLHAKFVLADDNAVFVSSANLTESGMRKNLELGVLIRGGRLPVQLRDHLERLKVNRVLVRRTRER